MNKMLASTLLLTLRSSSPRRMGVGGRRIQTKMTGRPAWKSAERSRLGGREEVPADWEIVNVKAEQGTAGCKHLDSKNDGIEGGRRRRTGHARKGFSAKKNSKKKKSGCHPILIFFGSSLRALLEIDSFFPAHTDLGVGKYHRIGKKKWKTLGDALRILLWGVHYFSPLRPSSMVFITPPISPSLMYCMQT